MPIGYHELGKSSLPKEWIVSHSALNILEEHPKKFFNYMTGNLEALESPSLDRGDLLHTWIEKKDSFVVSEKDKPSPSVANLIETFHSFYIGEKWKENSVFLQYIGQDYTIGMTELFKYHEIFTRLFQRKATEDEIKFLVYALRFSREEAAFNKNLKELTFLDKFMEDFEYLEFLKSANGKIILDKPTKDILFNCYNSIREHKFARALLFEMEGEHEKELFWEENIYDVTIKRKAKLDKIIIDVPNKHLTIIDTKTTSKPICQFLDDYGPYQKYNYGRQLRSYADGYFRTNCFESISADIETILSFGWKVDLFNVVVQTNDHFATQVFKTPYIEGSTKPVMKKLAEHIKSNQWIVTIEEDLLGYISI